MLKGVLPTMPVSTLRTNQDEITSTLTTSPVLLTHNGTATGVLVHHNQWNDLIELVNKLKEDIIINQRMWEMDNDPSAVLTEEEVRQQLAERGFTSDH